MFLKERLMVKVGPVLRNRIDFSKNCSGIVILNVNKKPPHLGFFCSRKYFSLTANEVQLDQDLDVLLELIDRKKIPSLFVSLNQHVELNEVSRIFSSFSNLSKGITCISPIKEISNQLLKVDVSDVNFIFQLVPLLQRKKHVLSYSQLNCDEFLEHHCLNLTTYTMDQVLVRIQHFVK